jgi:hypothetical protein
MCFLLAFFDGLAEKVEGVKIFIHMCWIYRATCILQKTHIFGVQKLYLSTSKVTLRCYSHNILRKKFANTLTHSWIWLAVGNLHHNVHLLTGAQYRCPRRNITFSSPGAAHSNMNLIHVICLAVLSLTTLCPGLFNPSLSVGLVIRPTLWFNHVDL